MGLIYTSTWPGGIRVATEIQGNVAQDSITYPREHADCGAPVEITRKRELTGLERHLVDQLRKKTEAPSL